MQTQQMALLRQIRLLIQQIIIALTSLIVPMPVNSVVIRIVYRWVMCRILYRQQCKQADHWLSSFIFWIKPTIRLLEIQSHTSWTMTTGLRSQQGAVLIGSFNLVLSKSQLTWAFGQLSNNKQSQDISLTNPRITTFWSIKSAKNRSWLSIFTWTEGSWPSIAKSESLTKCCLILEDFSTSLYRF